MYQYQMQFYIYYVVVYIEIISRGKGGFLFIESTLVPRVAHSEILCPLTFILERMENLELNLKSGMEVFCCVSRGGGKKISYISNVLLIIQ